MRAPFGPAMAVMLTIANVPVTRRTLDDDRHVIVTSNKWMGAAMVTRPPRLSRAKAGEASAQQAHAPETPRRPTPNLRRGINGIGHKEPPFLYWTRVESPVQTRPIAARVITLQFRDNTSLNCGVHGATAKIGGKFSMTRRSSSSRARFQAA